MSIQKHWCYRNLQHILLIHRVWLQLLQGCFLHSPWLQAVSIAETLLLLWFVTYTFVPSGLIATPKRKDPTGAWGCNSVICCVNYRDGSAAVVSHVYLCSIRFDCNSRRPVFCIHSSCNSISCCVNYRDIIVAAGLLVTYAFVPSGLTAVQLHF